MYICNFEGNLETKYRVSHKKVNDSRRALLKKKIFYSHFLSMHVYSHFIFYKFFFRPSEKCTSTNKRSLIQIEGF